MPGAPCTIAGGATRTEGPPAGEALTPPEPWTPPEPFTPPEAEAGLNRYAFPPPPDSPQMTAKPQEEARQGDLA